MNLTSVSLQLGKLEERAEKKERRRQSRERRTESKGRARGTGGEGGDGEEGEGGGGSWQFITFFGFQLLQHPRLLALFAVGLRLHMLSQIPWKGMRTDSGSAGGQGPRAVPGWQVLGRPSAQVLRWDVQPQTPCRMVQRSWGRVGEGCEGTKGIMKK